MKAYVKETSMIPLTLEHYSSVCSIHIKYLLQYRYFDGWGKLTCRGTKGRGLGQF
jgi:hypothetical protein